MLFKDLATLRTDIPLFADIDELRWQGAKPAFAALTEKMGDTRLATRVREVFTPPERQGASVPTHEIDELLLLSSWFRRFPDELDQTRAADEFYTPVQQA